MPGLVPYRPRPYAPRALFAVGPSATLRRVARALARGMVLCALLLLLVPWQQNAPGKGRVIAWAPEERQQAIEAPITGRVSRWYVREGDRVKEGDPLVELSDNDPALLERLDLERDALLAQLDAQVRRTAAVRERLTAMRARREATLLSADAKVRIAEERLQAAEQQLSAELAVQETSAMNLDRVEALAREGLASERDRELASMGRRQADAAFARAQASLRAAEADAQAARFDRSAIARDLDAQIAAIEAELESSVGSEAAAAGRLPDMDVEIARQHNQVLRAPRDGSVLRVLAGLGGEQVKSGESLLVIVPADVELAVELWVDGRDASLLSPDQPVRLRFEGWPSLQFSGWPSVAVGTFGGRVAFVDAADDGSGSFRVLVSPDPADAAWPEERWLRQGTQAQGWVMLSEVRLGYELWRQLNDFPPALANAPEVGGKKK